MRAQLTFQFKDSSVVPHIIVISVFGDILTDSQQISPNIVTSALDLNNFNIIIILSLPLIFIIIINMTVTLI